MKEFLVRMFRKYRYQHHLIKPVRLLFPPRKKEVTLPADDGFLSREDIQWWYWTGHLTGENGEKFGFEVVFFAFDSWMVFRNVLAQAAISDITGKTYSFREKIEFLTLPKKLKATFLLVAKNRREGVVISASGGGPKARLYFKTAGYEVSLALEEMFAPVVHYDGRLHHFEFGGNTFYYARENMKTTGVVIKDGVSCKVTGTSWFDRQYGELYQAIFKGWQWFAVKLDSGESIMLYYFRDDKYAGERFGSITRENDTKTLSGSDFTVEVLSTWDSPHTGIKYPSGWKITLLENTYFLQPDLPDQELRAQHHFWIGPEYWEGACTVKDGNGCKVGEAYIELNGYGRHKIITIC